MNFKQGEFTIAAQNWCDDDVWYAVKGTELTYHSKMGDRFTLHHTVELESNMSSERVRLAYEGDPNSEVCSATLVTFYGDMAKYNDGVWVCESMDIQRTAKDPVEALVQMLAMTY